jgi:hypothetical protein
VNTLEVRSPAYPFMHADYVLWHNLTPAQVRDRRYPGATLLVQGPPQRSLNPAVHVCVTYGLDTALATLVELP